MRSLIAVVLAAWMASCGGSSLSFSARAGAVAPAGAASSALVAATGITLTRVRLVIRKVELQKAGTPEIDEIATGPYLLDLSGPALDSGAVGKVLDASFTPGMYSEIEMQMHKPDSTETGVNADLKDMIAANASMIVDGTYNNAPFRFTTAVDAQQRFAGTIALKNGSNLTFNMDPSGWFLSNGAVLDPTASANQSTIENNIKASFKAFKDDSHQGRPDPS